MTICSLFNLLQRIMPSLAWWNMGSMTLTYTLILFRFCMRTVRWWPWQPPISLASWLLERPPSFWTVWSDWRRTNQICSLRCLHSFRMSDAFMHIFRAYSACQVVHFVFVLFFIRRWKLILDWSKALLHFDLWDACSVLHRWCLLMGMGFSTTEVTCTGWVSFVHLLRNIIYIGMESLCVMYS